MEEAQTFVNEFNHAYAQKHEAFETQFWGTKMALSSSDAITYSTDLLSQTKQEMENLLSDPEVLTKAQQYLQTLTSSSTSSTSSTSDDTKNIISILQIIIKTCQCYTYPTPESKSIREQTTHIESQLEKARNEMTTLGYTDSQGVFHPTSSVGLRTKLRTAKDEQERKSAYDGLRSIGTFVCQNGFLEIVKQRNRLAKLLGYDDYYDYTVSNAEGFGKNRLFEILDGLEQGTRELMGKARKELEAKFGAMALEPWNMGFQMSGSVISKMDPYFPFSKSVENYLRSYAAMNINYCDATMTLDLLDRSNKYSNGFCHWPIPAWIQSDGTSIPSHTNFTSLADPKAIGSGYTALTTLMHEAGHAAHFANIKGLSPLFSQERSPTSVAYAENQSMFLDSLVGDAAWRAKYATDVQGNPIPFEIIEEEIRSTHPFQVFALRAMLSVSYFEKALYELPDDQVTSENVQALADQIEIQIYGGLSPRPLLSVPHLVSDEASCYYQGYTLAEMSVHQTRHYFQQTYGSIVDNPNVGPVLAKAYWECGNSKPFLKIVKDLTGKDLDGKAWIHVLEEDLEEFIEKERNDYSDMIEKCQKEQNESEKKEEEEDCLDLGMTIKFVDGDLLISDSSKVGLLGACKEFEDFVAARTTGTSS